LRKLYSVRLGKSIIDTRCSFLVDLLRSLGERRARVISRRGSAVGGWLVLMLAVAWVLVRAFEHGFGLDSSSSPWTG